VLHAYNEANQLESTCIDADHSDACDGTEIEVPYTYDAFGNLTAEANTTYTYDAANRLISVTQGTTVTTHAYNGDGDRVSQTFDTGASGVTTAYLLDVATPLTMVLAEKVGSTITVMYWHGLDLLGQSDGTTVTSSRTRVLARCARSAIHAYVFLARLSRRSAGMVDRGTGICGAVGSGRRALAIPGEAHYSKCEW
jgi:YD repeat-containing protein